MRDAREVDSPALSLPSSMAPLAQGRVWRRNLVGQAGADVYRLPGLGPDQDLYLKHGIGRAADDLTSEMARLRWIGEHLPVPEVRCFVSSPPEAWLLSTALQGQTAFELLQEEPDSAASLVPAIARFLRRIHAIPVEGCPFNADHRLRLALARQHLEAGLVDTDDFDDDHAGWSAEQVWAEMTALLPIVPDSVVTHGDFSLDNLLCDGGEVVGCLDLGRAGIADRYQDLAILWNNLREFGEEPAKLLFEAYGIDRPDWAKLRFHLDLDEFF